MVGGGTTLVYMPSSLPSLGAPCPYTASLYTIRRQQRCSHGPGSAGLNGTSTVRSSPPKKEAFLHPENNPSSQQKQARNDQQFRHRESLRTRNPRMFEPSESDSKPPSRLGAAFNPGIKEEGYPLVYRCFLIKPD